MHSASRKNVASMTCSVPNTLNLFAYHGEKRGNRKIHRTHVAILKAASLHFGFNANFSKIRFQTGETAEAEFSDVEPWVENAGVIIISVAKY